MKIITTLAFIMCTYCQTFAQFYLTSAAETDVDDIVLIETISYGDKWYQAKKKVISKYDNGKIISSTTGGKTKTVFENSYTITREDDKEIIKRKSPNKAQNTTGINYFDDEDRLIKYELYATKDLQSPILIQHNFVYNSKNQVLSFQTTNPEKDTTLISPTEIEYFGKFSWKKSTFFSDNSFYELIAEYDSIQHAVIETSCSYHAIAEKNEETEQYERTSNSYSPNEDWIEYLSIEHDGRTKLVKKTIHKIKYVLDERGNWIENHLVDKKGKTKLLSKRSIKYK